MSVAIKKLEGVESVEVSLNDGAARVALKPGNTFDPESLRKVARDSGFTPKHAEVRVVGRLLEDSDVPVLEVAESGLRYVLADHPDTPGQLFKLTGQLMARAVAIGGEIPEANTRAATRILRVRSFEPAGR